MSEPETPEQPIAPKLKLFEDALRDAGLEPTNLFLSKMRRMAKRLNACYRIERKYYLTDDQFAEITEARRQILGDPSLSVAHTWLAQLPRRYR